MPNIKYWLLLSLSIVFEVAGTTIMKASQNSYPIEGMAVMYLLIGLSYYTLSKAVLRLPIGVAYAFWEGAGLALITLISFFLLHEKLGALRIGAICLLFAGTYLVSIGTDSPQAEEA